MRSTLALTKLSRTLLAGIRMIIITHLRQVFQVSSLRLLSEDLADLKPALSGACATIASDALMNPFDGVKPFLSLMKFHSDPTVQSSSSECKFMDRPTVQYLNALAPSTGLKVSPLSMSPILPRCA